MAKDAWQEFREDPNPLTKVGEVHSVLQAVAGKGNAPGLNTLFREARDSGVCMGVKVLRIGERIYIPRAPLVAMVEGTWWGPRQEETNTEDEVTE